MHGVGLAVHKACQPVLKKIPDNFLTVFISWALTFVYVSLLWVFFRAASFEDSVLIIKNIFVDFDWGQVPQFAVARPEWCIMMVLLIICHFLPVSWGEAMERFFVRSPWVIKLGIFLIAVQLVIEFMTSEVAPFIYFQF